jgi:hypothetical protein
MANVVQIAAKLYECRDAARTILGDKYQERMREYGDSIRSVAAAKECSELEAGKMLADAGGGGVATVLMLAATVEIIEPSNA